MKKFVLVCSRKGNYNECGRIYDAIYFKKGESDNYVFNKYTVAGFQGIIKYNKKISLRDIDDMTNSYEDSIEFLRNLKFYDPIYDMFVGYNTKGYVNKISPTFGREEIIRNSEKYVKDDKVKKSEVERVFDELFNEEDLYKLYMKDEYFKTRSLLWQIREYKRILQHVKKGIEGDNDGELLYYENAIKEDFSKYHLYRELFRATLDLQDHINKKVKKEEEVEKKIILPSSKSFENPNFQEPVVKQLILPGFDK